MAQILTIGHSTHPIDEFLGMVEAHGINMIVDVRTIPRSRHNLQFNQGSLATSLKNSGVEYIHMPGLGGLRHAKMDSVNSGWRNASFRGYADYMQTAEFAANIDELLRLAKNKRIAVMCAEAVPWRCHRSLIADAVLVRGMPTEDIMGTTRRHRHVLTPFAKVHGLTITYPAVASAGTSNTVAGRRSRTRSGRITASATSQVRASRRR